MVNHIAPFLPRDRTIPKDRLLLDGSYCTFYNGPVFVSYTQRRTETVIYSPLKSRHALLSPLVKTFLTLAVTFTSLVYL